MKIAIEHVHQNDQRARMRQKIYDDAEFFSGYLNDRESEHHSEEAIEFPGLRSMLPDVKGRRVLDLGSAMGIFTREFAEAGAAEVIGVDISERMIQYAREHNPHERVRYLHGAVEDLDLPAGSFDFVFAAYTFTMIVDHRAGMNAVARWLAPGGILLYSHVHPLALARGTELGWCEDSEGMLHWLIGGYSDESVRPLHVYGGTVLRYHRRFSTLVDNVLDAGLEIDRLLEPDPSPEQIAAIPNLELNCRRPTTLITRAHKPRTARAPLPPRLPTADESVRAAIVSLLPPLTTNRRVLEIGSPGSAMSRLLTERGAEVCSVATLDAAPVDSCIAIVASHALDGVEDLRGMLQRAFSLLAPGGSLIYTLSHPILIAGRAPQRTARDESGRLHYLLNHYAYEGPRSFGSQVRYHRKLSRLVNDLIESGFTFDGALEPEVRATHQELSVPMLVLRGTRPA